MRNRNKSLFIVGIASASLISGCCGNKVNEWKKTPGAQGKINLNDVKTAFQNDQNVQNFEKRVNEIFEGENLILFKSEPHRNGFQLKAYEDLDENKEISEGDEHLFTLTVANGRCTLEGLGVNGYYKETWNYQHRTAYRTRSYVPYRSRSPYFYHWYGDRYRWGGYYTPRSHYDSIYSHRNSYRNSTDYVNQVNSNTSYQNQMRSQHGAAYGAAMANVSPTRASYIQQKASNSSFRNTLRNRQPPRTRAAASRSRSSVRSSSRSSRSGSWGSRSSSGCRI